MSKKCLIASAVLAGAVASTASAVDTYVITLEGESFAGFTFNNYFPQGTFAAGSILQSVSVDAVLDASVNFTYADDLCFYVDVDPLSTGGVLQIGGFSNLSAANRYFWDNGGSGDPGTTVIDSQDVSGLGIDLSNYSVWVGNGYGASGTSGTWTGTVTFTVVPAPGAMALLGLAFAGGRRRKA